MDERPSILGLAQGLTSCAWSQAAARFRWGARPGPAQQEKTGAALIRMQPHAMPCMDSSGA